MEIKGAGKGEIFCLAYEAWENFTDSRVVWRLGSPMCEFCGDLLETNLHVMRDCPLVMHL
jgi:hypothetical protein